MAIIGINLNRDNPEYTIDDLKFWMPQMKNYLATQEGITAFNNLYPIANNKIYYSVYGSDWKLAMSLCIAHYLTLIAMLSEVPSGDSLSEIAGGQATRGPIDSASVGSFSVSYAIDKTMVDKDEDKWWNLTTFGSQLMALLETKGYAGGIFVVTSNPIPGSNF